MRILVISDTHGNTEFLPKLVEREKADLYLHAGDSGLTERDLRPFHTVKGNCDYYKHDVNYTEYTPYGKLIMRHHPFTESDIERYKKMGYKIFIYGHTHQRHFEKREDGIDIFNPGSLYYPRDGLYPCYLILDIDEKEVKHEFRMYLDNVK
ncbi:MAG: YfcE family phosphodiesterase [Coprobacillus sp.]|nr:YfcE family phosphodiesterase [Coprobacillus sp.]